MIGRTMINNDTSGLRYIVQFCLYLKYPFYLLCLCFSSPFLSDTPFLCLWIMLLILDGNSDSMQENRSLRRKKIRFVTDLIKCLKHIPYYVRTYF